MELFLPSFTLNDAPFLPNYYINNGIKFLFTFFLISFFLCTITTSIDILLFQTLRRECVMSFICFLIISYSDKWSDWTFQGHCSSYSEENSYGSFVMDCLRAGIICFALYLEKLKLARIHVSDSKEADIYYFILAAFK